MPILDAALAFALTMLLVASIVTQIVHLIQRLLNQRGAQFTKMLHEFYEKELKQVVGREMHRLSSEVDQGVAAGITATAEALKIEDLTPSGKELSQLTELSTIELKELLKRSKMGEELLKNLGDRAEAVFEALGDRYDILGDKFTAAFRAHASRWATVVALFLALAVNIDSFFIVGTYLNNESARNTVIAQGNVIVQGYEGLAKDLEQGNRAMVTQEDLEKVIKDAKENIVSLQATDFPVGWDHFPFSELTGADDPLSEQRNQLNGWVSWVLGILLTAFFAGLGAPFWYDTVTGIARVVHRGSNREG